LHGKISAANHVELFEIERAKQELRTQPRPRKQSRGFEKDSQAAGIVVGPRRAFNRIEMSAQNNQRSSPLSAQTADDIAKVLPSVGKGVAFDGEAIARQFFLDEALDFR